MGRLPSLRTPPLGLEAWRRAAPLALAAGVGQGEGPAPRTPSPRAPRPGPRRSAARSPAENVRIPPSLRRQLPAAGEGGELSLGVRCRGWRGRLESWGGRAVTTPSVQQERGRRVRAPLRPQPLAWPPQLRSCDSENPGPVLSASAVARHTHLAGPARVPALAGGASVSASPGRHRQGLGLPAELGLRPGDRDRGRRGRGETPPRPPTRPALLSSPFRAAEAMNSRCGGSGRSARCYGGGGAGSLCPPPPTPRPVPPSPHS